MKIHPDKPPFSSVLDAVGQTPLVEFSRYLDNSNLRLLTKLEAANPGGSAKDRPAKRMIEHALASKQIHPGTTIIESSSGNMGIGLAQACRLYGLPFICVVDPNAQQQNLAIIKALGGEIEPIEEKVDGSWLAARWHRVTKLLNSIEQSYWPNQYANLQNPLAHEEGTIREIDSALSGDFDYLFVATSSTGTARGCRDYLESRGRPTKVIAVDAVGSCLFGGPPGPRNIPGLGAGCIPQLAVGQNFDEVHRVTDLDCVVGCRRAAEREAALVGGSAGGVLETVRKFANELAGKTCVAILHDSGTRYLNTVFDDRWVLETTGVGADELKRMVRSRVAFSGVIGGSSQTECELGMANA